MRKGKHCLYPEKTTEKSRKINTDLENCVKIIRAKNQNLQIVFLVCHNVTFGG